MRKNKKDGQIEIRIALDLHNEICKRFLDPQEIKKSEAEEITKEEITKEEIVEKMTKDILTATSGIILTEMVTIFMMRDPELDTARAELYDRLEEKNERIAEAQEKNKGRLAGRVFEGVAGTIKTFQRDLKHTMDESYFEEEEA